MYNITKEKRLRFDWDKNKESINIEKHKISFSEAALVFYDDEAIVITDPDHSDDEERFIILGMNNKAEILVVVYCLRNNESVIRIISARKATNNEYITYFQRRGIR